MSENYLLVVSFQALNGCRQFNDANVYNTKIEFFSTKDFKHYTRTANATVFRFGVLGTMDGNFAFSAVKFPFDGTVYHDVILGGWANAFSSFRKKKRTEDKMEFETDLRRFQTTSILHPRVPFIFKMIHYDCGEVVLFKEGETQPFYSAKSDVEFSSNFVGFFRTTFENIFFFDCPVDKKHQHQANEERRTLDININLENFRIDRD
jgi:hypothetical protein